MKIGRFVPAALMAAFTTVTPGFGQYASLSLDLKVTLYASDEGRNMYPLPAQSDLGVVFVKGTPDDKYDEAVLAKAFNLSKVRTAGEARLDVRWPGEEIPNERIAQAFRLNGRDFLLVLIPVKVGFREHIYSFKAEVYELDAGKGTEIAQACGQNVDLNAFGLLGFFFKDKTYFLTVKLLNSGWGASIPRPPVFMGPTKVKGSD
jgi:hypothetical protein